MIMHPSFHIAY